MVIYYLSLWPLNITTFMRNIFLHSLLGVHTAQFFQLHQNLCKNLDEKYSGRINLKMTKFFFFYRRLRGIKSKSKKIHFPPNPIRVLQYRRSSKFHSDRPSIATVGIVIKLIRSHSHRRIANLSFIYSKCTRPCLDCSGSIIQSMLVLNFPVVLLITSLWYNMVYWS